MLRADAQSEGLPWNYDRSELLTDGIIHVLGLALACIGAIAITTLSFSRAGGVQTLPVLVYAAGLLAMLGFSAAYNLCPVSPRKWLLRRFDQSAIFLFIAATYTPFIIQMKVATWTMLVGVWTVAGVGILLKVLAPGRYERATIALYLLLGWSGLVAYDSLFSDLSPSTTALLVAGGLLYSGGLVFHVWEKLRFQNAIWHLFVLAAAACHYTAVFGLTFAHA